MRANGAGRVGASNHLNGDGRYIKGGSGLTNGGDGGDNFTELELVQDGGLSGGVETDHQDSHLLATP